MEDSVLKYGIKHILFALTVSSVALTMRQVWIETAESNILAATPIVIATMVVTAANWENRGRDGAIRLGLIVGGLVAISLNMERFLVPPSLQHRSMAGKGFFSPEALFVFAIVAQSVIAAIVASFVSHFAVHFKPWIVANSKPIWMTAAFGVAFGILGHRLAELPVFSEGFLIKTVGAFVVAGLITGVAWAHWIVGFVNVENE